MNTSALTPISIPSSVSLPAYRFCSTGFSSRSTDRKALLTPPIPSLRRSGTTSSNGAKTCPTHLASRALHLQYKRACFIFYTWPSTSFSIVRSCDGHSSWTHGSPSTWTFACGRSCMALLRPVSSGSQIWRIWRICTAGVAMLWVWRASYSIIIGREDGMAEG